MKNFLALMLSMYVLIAMVHASDAQPHHIDLHGDAKEKLKKHVITLIKPFFSGTLSVQEYLIIQEYLNIPEYTDISITYIPKAKRYFVKLEFTNTNVPNALMSVNQGCCFNKKEFNAAIGEPTSECCC
ncbi:MAG TPA: hypothetical protein VLG50_08535 [Candidatus Saccharimonadales bacterium]|nr:hypothetical protein [Candidatus Saccharimonadales bacterium]